MEHNLPTVFRCSHMPHVLSDQDLKNAWYSGMVSPLVQHKVRAMEYWVQSKYDNLKTIDLVPDFGLSRYRLYDI